MTLTLTQWPSYTNLMRTSWRYTGCADMNFLRQCFRKLSSDRHADDRQVTRGHFRSCDKDGGHTIRSAVFKNPMIHANLVDLLFVEPELWAIEVYIVKIGILDVFGSCNLDLDQMTFIYELDLYCLELYRMFKHEFPTSRLSKVIVWETDTDIHTGGIDRNYKTHPIAGGQKCGVIFTGSS